MKQTITLNPEKLRQAMRAWASGVTIVTAAHDGDQHGMTVSSFTSVSLEPPLVIISVQTGSRTQRLISRSNIFAVTILADGQQEISDRFAGRVPDEGNRLEGIQTETLVSGVPFIKGGLAYLDCRVTQVVPVGTNTLFVGEVVAAQGDGEGQPLVYHDRNYQKLVD